MSLITFGDRLTPCRFTSQYHVEFWKPIEVLLYGSVFPIGIRVWNKFVDAVVPSTYFPKLVLKKVVVRRKMPEWTNECFWEWLEELAVDYGMT